MTTTPLLDQSELDQQWLDEMNRAMESGGGVQLPFQTITAWPRSGSRQFAQFAKESPVSYFGGWNADDEKIQELADTGSLGLPFDQLPWQRIEMQSDSGNYIVYETRVIHASIISYRMSWISKDGRNRTQQYDEGHPRSHTQYLALLGVTGPDKKIAVLCPAIVTVKGKGQTEAMKNALAAWRKAIDVHRRELGAQKLPLAAFWVTLGTTGDKPEFQSVGKGGQSHEITPMRAVMPQDKPTAEQIAVRFVGKETLKRGYDLLAQAKDWIAAWKNMPGAVSNDFHPAPQPDEDTPW